MMDRENFILVAGGFLVIFSLLAWTAIVFASRLRATDRAIEQFLKRETDSRASFVEENALIGIVSPSDALYAEVIQDKWLSEASKVQPTTVSSTELSDSSPQSDLADMLNDAVIPA